jgi:hypothetical protein
LEEPKEIIQEADEESLRDNEEIHNLAAADLAKTNTKYPCWFNYKFGKCTKAGCKLDHEREAMTRYQDERLQELIKSELC